MEHEMVGRVYRWNRLWCPRGTDIRLASGGYPYYDSVLASFFSSSIVPFSSIANTPCLVLLGEPGIGKTYAMRVERDTINAQVKESGDTTLWLDLHQYGSEDRLVRALFENETFVTWLEGQHKLHLFLDSLDECLLRIDTVGELLGDELSKYPVERLFLRLTCRTMDWPVGLEYSLKKLWGEDNVGVYELAPLRRKDIAEAVRENSLQPDVFLAEIDRMDVAPLAIKPVTLEFLITTYKRYGRFPSTQTELYEQGCRLLCGETNEGRRGAKLTGDFTAEQRMAVASRIAAVTVFANKAAVWVDLDRGDVPEDDVVIGILIGRTEPADNGQLQVSEAAIRETLATGLFSSRGLKRMGWAHQTYAEFLAARYLVKHSVTLPQMMSLITAYGLSERRVVPPLRETAAWLAGAVPDLFQAIVRTDPFVLLKSDVAAFDDGDIKTLVGRLLKLYDEEKLLDRHPEVHRYYDRLCHSTLAEQLRPYIVNPAKGILVRRVATDIAEACGLQVLQDDLVRVAIDPAQPHAVRVNSAYAVYRIGDDTARSKLKPLALEQAGCDPDDELKGCGLLAIWPDHLTAKELFATLTLPKQDDLFGLYSSFLSSDFTRHLQPAELPLALRWLEEQPLCHQLPLRFAELLDAILLAAWKNLDTPEVLDALAKAVLFRLSRYDKIVCSDIRHSELGDRLKNDHQRRRLLVENLVGMIAGPDALPFGLMDFEFPLVASHDLLWMLDRFAEARSEHERAVWTALISKVFYQCEPNQYDAVLTAVNTVPVLSEAFGDLVKPVSLNSPLAQKMRDSARSRREREDQLSSHPTWETPPSEKINELLEREAQGPAVWWRLNWVMRFYEDGRCHADEFEPDLMALPGWENATNETRARIVETAKRYVLCGEPNTPKWLGTNKIYRPAYAGYRALLLLLQHDPEFVRVLPGDVWAKWAPIIFAYPQFYEPQREGLRKELLARAYHYAPEETLEALVALVDKCDRGEGCLLISQEIESLWDDRLADTLLEKAQSRTLKPQTVGYLLDDLLKHRCEEARRYAESLIPLPLPPNGYAREMAVVAARSLVRYTFDASWSVLWPAFEQEPEFGREVMLSILSWTERPGAAVAQRLSEDQLADLYVWLSRQYPHAEDPRHSGWHFVEPRENIAEWRDSLLRFLVQRGTPAACQAVERITQELPEIEQLKAAFLEAQEITRRKTWTPPRPEDILRLASDREARLVTSANELVEVLIDALGRLEATLHGETPAVRDIWDQIRPGVYRPVHEPAFSDYVKRHLEAYLNQRGVVINREVQIRRGTGGDPGERTDIHIDAVVPGSTVSTYDAVTVIIEVKGCWHREVETAMKTQLVGRYLRESQCHHGIYLVGWFNCAQWDDKDSRKSSAPRKTAEEVQKQLDSQAAELSGPGVYVKAFVMNTALR